jgi:ribose 5-phosphate isomerase A
VFPGVSLTSSLTISLTRRSSMSSAAAGGVAASAQRALSFVEDGQTLGLGTGRAANAFVQALGERVRDGLRVRGVATSEATAALARDLGIPLVELAEAGRLDVTFDGADEVDPGLELIKGYGGALVREKIVAASSDRLVILVGAEKLVPALGSRGRLPVEVVPFARSLCERRLSELGMPAAVRRGEDGESYLTDNGNLVLDCRVEGLSDPGELDRRLCALPGVLGTGLFVGMADAVVVQDGDQVNVLERRGG